jgi:hypothetical protein
LGYNEMMFCALKADGSGDIRVLSERHLGSGHPSVNADSTFLVTDASPNQDWIVPESGEIPIRLIDLGTDTESWICTVSVDLAKSRYDRNSEGGSHFKLDPHPAWSRDYKKVCFNGAIDGTRRVFIADLSDVV